MFQPTGKTSNGSILFCGSSTSQHDTAHVADGSEALMTGATDQSSKDQHASDARETENEPPLDVQQSAADFRSGSQACKLHCASAKQQHQQEGLLQWQQTMGQSDAAHQPASSNNKQPHHSQWQPQRQGECNQGSPTSLVQQEQQQAQQKRQQQQQHCIQQQEQRHMVELQQRAKQLEEENTALRAAQAKAEMLCSRMQRMQEAERLKQHGNRYYQSQQCQHAQQAYTEALALAIEDPSFNAVLLCNRAAAHHSNGQYLDAIADCYMAAELDDKYPRVLQVFGSGQIICANHSAASCDCFQVQAALHVEQALTHPSLLTVLCAISATASVAPAPPIVNYNNICSTMHEYCLC
eukprot:GHRR01026767.1.p1 GENE.GHRR01026767.1~~GHRR01026767.1.p1  ORF type:complete len:352 (+),score=132.55 GHRR01026767.1:740-1795(+)